MSNTSIFNRHIIRSARRANAEAVVNLTQRRKWFDEAGDVEKPEQPGTQPEQGAGQDGGNDDSVTLTKRSLTQRLKRAEQTALNNLLKGLGVENVDDLKKRVSGQQPDKKAEQPNPQNAAQDEAAQRLEKLEEELASLREEREKTKAEQQAATVNDAIKAAVKGVKYPDDVVAWIRSNHADIAKALKEDGSVDSAIVNTAIEEVRKARPEWFAIGGPGSPSNFGGTTPEVDKKRREAASKNQTKIIRSNF
jgi:hypothetical protein